MVESAWSYGKKMTEAGDSAAGLIKEHATIGASIVIKGDVSGNEPLFIDGTVEGSVNVAGQRVTMGRSSHIRADIHAQDVVVMGNMNGNIYCADLLDVRADSFIEGPLVAKRIRIDDGASLKGSVEVHPAKGAERSTAIPKRGAKKPTRRWRGPSKREGNGRPLAHPRDTRHGVPVAC